mgnify:CR=1 FL=1
MDILDSVLGLAIKNILNKANPKYEAWLLQFHTTNEDVDVSIQNIAGFEFGSISIWFNLDTSNTTNELFYYGIPSDVNKRLDISIGQATSSLNDESCYFGLVNGADFNSGKKYLAVVRKGHTFYQDSKWHNMVCTVGSAGCSIFMDGVKQPLTFLFSSSSIRRLAILIEQTSGGATG